MKTACQLDIIRCLRKTGSSSKHLCFFNVLPYRLEGICQLQLYIKWWKLSAWIAVLCCLFVLFTYKYCSLNVKMVGFSFCFIICKRLLCVTNLTINPYGGWWTPQIIHSIIQGMTKMVAVHALDHNLLAWDGESMFFNSRELIEWNKPHQDVNLNIYCKHGEKHSYSCYYPQQTRTVCDKIPAMAQ